MKKGTGAIAALFTVVIVDAIALIILFNTVMKDLNENINMSILFVTLVSLVIFDGFLMAGTAFEKTPNSMRMISSASGYLVVQSLCSFACRAAETSVTGYIVATLVVALLFGLTFIFLRGTSETAESWGKPNEQRNKELNARDDNINKEEVQ